MLPNKTKQLSVSSATAAKMRIAIVAAQYNPELVDVLLDFTAMTLAKNGVKQIEAVRVPGSYEIPLVAAKLAASKKFHAVIALGIVFQGKTSHADHIASAATINLQRSSIETGVPIIHQILTPRTVSDAKARIEIRGVEAAHTAIQMVEIMQGLKKGKLI